MSRFKLKKRSKGEAPPVEINVTPMLDMFSVLISFLLITAVFSSVGFERIEVPFLSSAPPKTKQEVDKDPQKVVTLVIDNEKAVLEIGMSNSSADVKKEDFPIDEAGLNNLQAKIYTLRSEDKRFDMVTIMQEPETKYEILIKILDTLRILKPGRTPIPLTDDQKPIPGVEPDALIPKIVLGDVALGG